MKPALGALDALAERRIAEAQQRGEFDGLPGAGAPLALDNDALVPEELRAAYRLLRNAGCLPPELAMHAEIRDIEQLLPHIGDETERARLLSRLNFLFSRSSAGRRHGGLGVEDAYLRKIAAHLEKARPKRST